MRGRVPSFLRLAALALAAAAALALPSCAHQPAMAPSGWWFQHLAREGAAVLTTTDKALIARAAGLPALARERLGRLSVLQEEDRYVALVECDLGRGLFNSAMAVSQEWNRSPQKDCYTNSEGRIKLDLIQDGLLLLTDGSFAEARTLVEDSLFSPPSIDDGAARLMADSDAAFRVDRPRKLPPLSVIPANAALEGIDEIVVCLGGGGLDLRASFESEALRRSFGKLFKLNYIALLKRAGVEIDIPLLKQRIVEEGRTMAATGLLLPAEEASRLFGGVGI